jgi:CRP/FNR family transcriptional regulator, cyclic AMP receptor protein
MKSILKKHLFSVSRYLAAEGLVRAARDFRTGQEIFRQGGAADALYYIRRGTVKFTAVSAAGREVVVGILKAGAFFGEDCLVDKHKHMTTASAVGSTSLLVLRREEMIRVLHKGRAFSYRFILHTLKRRARIEEDLIDQFSVSIEKRLARALLLLANYGKKGRPHKIIPRISEKTLAKMIGTSRGRVNMFMKKFYKFGYIDYDGGIRIDPSLLSVVLVD